MNKKNENKAKLIIENAKKLLLILNLFDKDNSMQKHINNPKTPII